MVVEIYCLEHAGLLITRTDVTGGIRGSIAQARINRKTPWGRIDVRTTAKDATRCCEGEIRG
jgi:hypothetical protein